jgi:hypothetical protein
MMAARHGMPGTCYPEPHPIAYGMIGWREAAIVSDGGQSVAPQITPFPTGRVMSVVTRHFMPGYPRFVPPGQKARYANFSFFICVHPRSSAVALSQPFICGSECSGSAKIRP